MPLPRNLPRGYLASLNVLRQCRAFNLRRFVPTSQSRHFSTAPPQWQVTTYKPPPPEGPREDRKDPYRQQGGYTKGRYTKDGHEKGGYAKGGYGKGGYAQGGYGRGGGSQTPSWKTYERRGASEPLRKPLRQPQVIDGNLVFGENVREKMEKKEAELLQQRDLATTPNVALTNTTGSMGPASGGDDFDDGPGVADVGANGELGEDFSGYKRITKGDLCELRMPDETVDCGIYLRDSPGASIADFLMPQGVIKQMQSARIAFYVPGFASANIGKFLEYFERVEKFEASRGNTMKSEHAILSREVSAPLLEPVREFILEANDIHGNRYNQFSALYQQLAHETETLRVTTQDAAQMVFGDDPKDTELYATHMALMGDGLRYLGDKGFHRITSNFRIRSKRELSVINDCTTWVRESTVVFDTKGNGTKAKGPMKEFIDKSRILIDRSRRLAKEKAGTLGRSVEPVEAEITWTESDQKFIEFVIARLKSYGLQRTTIEGLLPYILRQTRRYENRPLDATCSYDFLREIGVYTPWENHILQQENQKLPGFNISRKADEDQARLASVNDAPFESLGLQDSLKSIRKDWGNTLVFCIDEATAQEIDDGFSVEQVSETETWIHVHIANPTAFLTPDHWISKIAKERTTTKYFSPIVFSMLPKSFTHTLGVSNGAPVLTFSTKIDNNGEILDVNVQPGTVHNVKQITYNQLGKLLNVTSVAKRSFFVGELPPSIPEPQINLPTEELQMLLHLRKCQHALMKRRARNGMISLRNVNSSYTVSPEALELSPSGDHLRATTPTLYRGFPAMRLDVDVEPPVDSITDFVAEFMILANSAIAKYATKHNIPLPFRRLDYNTDRPELVEYFKQNIMSTRDEWGVAARRVMDDLNVYLKVGFAQILPRAGPHIMMGLPEGYCKATSPLRRYSDMVAHWNLQSHLLGTPLTFNEADMTALLASIDVRERMANFGSNETRRFWSSLCVSRIIQSGQKKQFPEKMTMTVLESKIWPTPCVGFVDELALMGKAEFPNSKSHQKIKPGDKVEVKLEYARPGERSVMFSSDAKVVKVGALHH